MVDSRDRQGLRELEGQLDLMERQERGDGRVTMADLECPEMLESQEDLEHLVTRGHQALRAQLDIL